MYHTAFNLGVKKLYFRAYFLINHNSTVLMSISFFLFYSNKTFKYLRKKNTLHGLAIVVINKVLSLAV